MITIKTVEHIAKLARLQLSEEEKKTYCEHMTKIMGYFDELAAIDTTDIEPMSHPLPIVNVLREDIVVPAPPHDVLLKTAPDREDAFFRVPKIRE
jgi:aspartyl-tRNA(Asn)/glutamyl-tRNA(Gln) amidotransferase subunit C